MQTVSCTIATRKLLQLKLTNPLPVDRNELIQETHHYYGSVMSGVKNRRPISKKKRFLRACSTLAPSKRCSPLLHVRYNDIIFLQFVGKPLLRAYIRLRYAHKYCLSASMILMYTCLRILKSAYTTQNIRFV